MNKDLFEAFIHAKSSKEFWDDICERFGLTSGLLLYELQHEIVNFKQEGSFVTMYYNKLKWFGMR